MTKIAEFFDKYPSFGFAIFILVFAFIIFSSMPKVERHDNRYNECISIVLRDGNIADANTMCAHLKG